MGRHSTAASHIVGSHRRSSSSDSSNPAFSAPLRAFEIAWREADCRDTEVYRRGPLPGGPTMVKHGRLRFLISAAPTTATLARYAQYCQSLGVEHVVRVCEPTYGALRLKGHQLELHDWPFEDGCPPPEVIVKKWLSLIDQVFGEPDSTGPTSPVIALHCMAGLGRAPVLVALALIEWGMHPFEAVGTIRALRRGAINARQMAFLEKYTPRADIIEQQDHAKHLRRQETANTKSKSRTSLSPTKSARRYSKKFNWMKSRSHQRDSPVAVNLSRRE